MYITFLLLDALLLIFKNQASFNNKLAFEIMI